MSAVTGFVDPSYLWEPSEEGTCSVVDDVTGASCTKRAGAHLVHADHSDPSTVFFWEDHPCP